MRIAAINGSAGAPTGREEGVVQRGRPARAERLLPVLALHSFQRHSAQWPLIRVVEREDAELHVAAASCFLALGKKALDASYYFVAEG